MVTKEEYKAWEKQVIEVFYEGPRVTELVPREGAPAVLKKQKFILYALEADGKSANLVEQSQVNELVKKDHLLMFHAGSQSLQKVSRGLEGDTFFHPAFDVGGLTNYRQDIGKHAEKAGDAILLRPDGNLEECAASIQSQWSQLAQKEMPKQLHSDLKAWLVSVLLAFKTSAQLHFLALPQEHRVLITAGDVRQKTGTYFTRCFGGSVYAEEAKGDTELFCAVSREYVTPNINMKNIDLEYYTYSSADTIAATGGLA
ncbi:unnamed protein product [Durusdinium trenchii]|uniref:Uncharacterized protein n=2 Tax=Durusdinium trenchii TaxID=1381693 RepID=A0ABP0KUS5_9DINO